MQLKRFHYFSGLTLALFVGLHLFNHLWSLAGPAAHIDMMATLRLIYRNPVVEAPASGASYAISTKLKLDYPCKPVKIQDKKQYSPTIYRIQKVSNAISNHT